MFKQGFAMNRLAQRCLLIWIGLLLVACAPRVPDETPTPATSGNTRSTSTPTRLTPTPLEPTPVALNERLPMPAVFIGNDNQLWRIERDGGTLIQLTEEPEEILEFSLARNGAQIAYLSGPLEMPLGGHQPAWVFNAP